MKLYIILVLATISHVCYSQNNTRLNDVILSNTLIDSFSVKYSTKKVPSKVKEFLQKRSLHNSRFFTKRVKKNCFDCSYRVFKWYAFSEKLYLIFYQHFGRGNHFHILIFEQELGEIKIFKNIIILEDMKSIDNLKKYLSENRVLEADKQDF
jgi:hypothetical protein